jgi:hypothetical protein
VLDRKTFKRAVGEVVMIVVGVLIALAASDWQQGRSERRAELDVLGELRTALNQDLEDLEAQVLRYERIDRRVSTLLEIMDSGAPYADSLDAYFGTLYGIDFPRLNRAGYESLKSRGLDLISDDALRSQIARVYEQSYARLDDALDSERMVILDLLRPYFLVHFKDLRFNVSATPLDYGFVSTDPQFLNLVDYRIQLVRQNHLGNFDAALPEIRSLVAALDGVLGG